MQQYFSLARAFILASTTSILISCQQTNQPPVSRDGFEFGKTASALSEIENRSGANANYERVHLLKFVSEGYSKLQYKWSSLDVGLDTANCELIPPRAGTRAANFPWGPADLYSNIETEEEKQSAGARGGEKDIFFDGDNNNRNGRGQSFDWTIVPETTLTNSMDFLNKKIDKNDFSYFFRFRRTGILFETVIRVRALRNEQGCNAVAYLCDSKHLDVAAQECSAGGWRHFRKVMVGVNVTGALTDKVRVPKTDRERNDISYIKVALANVDAEGNPSGDVYEEIVAKK